MERIELPMQADLAEFLTQKSALHTATGWALAAAVAAAVGPAPGHGGRPGNNYPEKGNYLTVSAIANMNIRGLRKTDTIARYRDAWFDAGLPQPILGKTVELPDIDWGERQTLITQHQERIKAQVELMHKLESSMSGAEGDLIISLKLLDGAPVYGQMAEAFSTKAERMIVLCKQILEITTKNVAIDWDSEFIKLESS
jgi:hypothetical protein